MGVPVMAPVKEVPPVNAKVFGIGISGAAAALSAAVMSWLAPVIVSVTRKQGTEGWPRGEGSVDPGVVLAQITNCHWVPVASWMPIGVWFGLLSGRATEKLPKESQFPL